MLPSCVWVITHSLYSTSALGCDLTWPDLHALSHSDTARRYPRRGDARQGPVPCGGSRRATAGYAGAGPHKGRLPTSAELCPARAPRRGPDVPAADSAVATAPPPHGPPRAGPPQAGPCQYPLRTEAASRRFPPGAPPLRHMRGARPARCRSLGLLVSHACYDPTGCLRS